MTVNVKTQARHMFDTISIQEISMFIEQRLSNPAESEILAQYASLSGFSLAYRDLTNGSCIAVLANTESFEVSSHFKIIKMARFFPSTSSAELAMKQAEKYSEELRTE